ncbi:MAG: carbohydrate-binding family 9-like protein [Candidatus Latescibacterota bacterium]|nr:carbohydrate-binding family 9-like protein [Candidatus Latescibacterota bacterium]
MRRLVPAPVAVLLCLVLTLVCVHAEEGTDWERQYDAGFARGPIIVDGIPNELSWQLAPEVGLFTRFQSDDLTPQFQTMAKILWDDENLYFLIAVDDPDIWSTMVEGDKVCLCREETIELFIDPDGDGKDYGEIHINCLDTINDLWIPNNEFKYANGDPVDWPDLYSWKQQGMRHAVMNHGTVNDSTDVDQGSVFEFALPWSGFGKIAGSASVPPQPGDVWRINVNRYERPRREAGRSQELSGWAPLNLQSYHVPDRLGYVRFIEDGR